MGLVQFVKLYLVLNLFSPNSMHVLSLLSCLVTITWHLMLTFGIDYPVSMCLSHGSYTHLVCSLSCFFLVIIVLLWCDIICFMFVM